MSSIFGGGTTKEQATTNTTQNQNSQAQQNQQATNNTTQTNTGSSNQTNTSGPGALSLPYLTGALQDASGIYGLQNGNTSYNGQLYAGLNPQQLQALTNINNYAMGAGTGVANAETGAGMGALGSLEQGGAIGSAVGALATGNPTQYNITNAGQYANNPYVQSEITAANTPIQQELNENAIPGLNMSAVGTGNTDSSRAALQDAILQRDASTQESNNAANILNSNYENGLNLSQSGLSSGELTGAMDANALTSNGAAGLGALNTGYQTNINNNNIPLQTGTALQQNQQNQDTANYQQYAMNMQQPWTTLGNYYSLISNPYLGNTATGNLNSTQTGNLYGTQYGTANSTSSGTAQGTSNTTGSVTQPGPGVLGGLLGAATGIGSLFTGGGLGGILGGSGLLGSLFSAGGGGSGNPADYYGNVDVGGGS